MVAFTNTHVFNFERNIKRRAHLSCSTAWSFMLETGNVKQRRCTPVVVQAQAVEPGCALPVHHAADHG